MTLAAAFLARARPGLGAGLDTAQLEQSLAGLIARGRARWPQLPLDPSLLAAEIGTRVLTLEALASICAEDVHLAVACMQQVQGALAAFDATCLNAGALTAALRRIDSTPAFVDEVRQVVREHLFVPPPGRIADYTGRGALAGWTRVTALRVALRLRPKERGEPADGERAVDSDPELRLLQRQYGQRFQEALSASFARLDDEQHNLLRLQFVNGLGTAQIAALFSVDRSTIKRRLAACRATLLEQTEAALRESLGLSPRSFASLARVLTSQLNLSIARLLKERS